MSENEHFYLTALLHCIQYKLSTVKENQTIGKIKGLKGSEL